MTRFCTVSFLVALGVPSGCYSDPATLLVDTDAASEGGTSEAPAGSASAGETSASGPSSATVDDGDGSASASGHDGDATSTGADDQDVDASDDHGEDTTDGGAGSSGDDGDSSTGAPVDASRIVFLLVEAGAPMAYGGLVGADAACQAEAEAAGLSGSFFAWLSTTNATTPAARFSKIGGPFVRTDGVVIAEDWADLVDGELAAPILVTADGVEYSAAAQPESNVVTHTNADGTHPGGITPCNGYTSNSVVGPRQGEAGATDATWTQSVDPWACDSNAAGGPSLYCFEQ